MIDIDVLLTGSYGCSAFRSEPGLAVLFYYYWDVLEDIKLSMPERIHSETKVVDLEALCLKKAERGASAM